MSRISLLKEPRRQVYLQRVGLFLPPPPQISQCTRLYYVPGTYNVGLPIQYRFNVGPALQPIAGSMLVNRIRRWPNNETELGDCPVFALTAIRVTLYALKGHYPDNTIHWANCEIMLGHRLQRLANIITTKNRQALNHEYNREYIFSEDFLNMEVINLKTGVQKCQPFPTHSTPLSPK